MTKNKKGFNWDGKSRVVTDVYRKRFTEIFGKKQQWRWRCGYRDAYSVCLLFWPHAHVKLEKIQKIIDHYSPDKIMEGNVVDLQHYRMWMNLE